MGMLALLGATMYVEFHAPSAAAPATSSRAPRQLPREARLADRAARELQDSQVVPTALIEAAEPPVIKPNQADARPKEVESKSKTADVKPKPAATKPPAIEPTAKPKAAVARPSQGKKPKQIAKGQRTRPLAPVRVAPADTATSQSEKRIILDGITASLPPSLLQLHPGRTNLVTKTKTPFVTPAITPAVEPQASKTAAAPTRDNKLRIETGKDEPATSGPTASEPAVVEKAAPATPSEAQPKLAEAPQPHAAPQPVEAAKPAAKSRLAEAAKKPAKPSRVEAATPPVEPKVVEAEKPAAEPKLVQAAPAEVPKPSAEPKLAEVAKPSVAPKQTDVAPRLEEMARQPRVAAKEPIAVVEPPVSAPVATEPADKKLAEQPAAPEDPGTGHELLHPLPAQDLAERATPDAPHGDVPAVEPKMGAEPKIAAVPHRMPVGDSSRRGAESDEPTQSKLPWSEPTPRTPEVVATVKRAEERVRHGFELAQRAALYSARAEFTAALKLIAQAYDAQQGTRHHTKSVAAGLTALREAGDFVRQSQNLAEADIAKIAALHTTPVLKDADTSDMTPVAAAQAYYTYAQEQLSAATAQEICGSMALFGMGKVEIVNAKTSGQHLEHTGQAIALFRASLIASPKNFRAANELGVLLAENGQLELARDLLISSVSVAPQVATWKNLAVVHSRAGQKNLAQQAQGQALALQKAGHDAGHLPAVQWVDAATFASTSSASDSLPIVPPSAKGQPSPAGRRRAEQAARHRCQKRDRRAAGHQPSSLIRK